MFDALRRAEEERRRRSSLSADERVTQDRREPPSQMPRPDVNGFPAGLLEELGILKNAVESALKGKKKKILLFTSAIPGEGTSTIGASYAKLLDLQSEGRILLCEMNARSPSLKKLFSINDDFGVTDYFSGTRNLVSITHPLVGGNLDVVHIGKEDPAFIQINLQNVFPSLLREAAAAYDTVIFDAPSVVNSPETPPMSSYVDGVILVIHAGKTKREVIQRSIDAIERSGGSVLGVILNRKKYYIPNFLYKRI